MSLKKGTINIGTIIKGGSSSGGIKIYTEVFTPTIDETSHTFTHNLGAVPDMVMCYWGILPVPSSKIGSSLDFAFGLRDGIFKLSEATRYFKHILVVEHDSTLTTQYSIDSSITDSTTNTSKSIYNANENTFSISPNRNNSGKFLKGLTYFVIAISGIGEQ